MSPHTQKNRQEFGAGREEWTSELGIWAHAWCQKAQRVAVAVRRLNSNASPTSLYIQINRSPLCLLAGWRNRSNNNNNTAKYKIQKEEEEITIEQPIVQHIGDTERKLHEAAWKLAVGWWFCLLSCVVHTGTPPPVSFLLSLIASRRDDQTLARAWVLYYNTSAVVVVVAAGSFTHTLIFSLSLDFHFFVCVCVVRFLIHMKMASHNLADGLPPCRFSHNPDSRESSDFLFVSSSWVSGLKWDAGNITLFPRVVAIAIPCWLAELAGQCLKWAPVGWAPTLQAARPATVHIGYTPARLLMKTCELRGRWWLLLLGFLDASIVRLV